MQHPGSDVSVLVPSSGPRAQVGHMGHYRRASPLSWLGRVSPVWTVQREEDSYRAGQGWESSLGAPAPAEWGRSPQECSRQLAQAGQERVHSREGAFEGTCLRSGWGVSAGSHVGLRQQDEGRLGDSVSLWEAGV